MADNFGLKIGLEGEKEFKKALADINQSFKVLGSEMKLVDSQFDKNDNSVQALTARNEVLQKSIDAQKSKIETLRAALQNADNSSGKFEALGGVCKAVGATIAAAFAAVSAAAIAAGKALVDMTREGAKYADSVLTESTVTGIATDKLQEYMYAAELVDVSTDTLTKSMAKQIKSMKSAADGSKSYADAYAQLGVSVTDANGNLRDSDMVYWELIEALGKLENETERDALGMTLLGKSAQELNPLIVAGAERMKELGEQAHEAGYVIGEDMLKAYGNLDDQIQYLTVGATAAKNALGTILLPILTAVNTLIADKDKLLDDCRYMQSILSDTSEIEEELKRQNEELEVLTEMLRKCVEENTHKVQNQKEYWEKYNSIEGRWNAVRSKIAELEETKKARTIKAEIIGAFMFELHEQDCAIEDFDARLWTVTIDSVVVNKDGSFTYKFRNDLELTVPAE